MKSKDFKFTEEYIQDKLNGFFSMSTQKYILENLYVFDWESDKFIETRSGLIYEFEIKVTKSDFKADFKKKDKHAILEGKDEFVPSYDEMSDVYKKSQRGCCSVFWRDKWNKKITYEDGLTWDEAMEDTLMETIFKDGKMVKEESLAEIRSRLNDGKF